MKAILACFKRKWKLLLYWGYIGTMEIKMETTTRIVNWG